MWCFFVATSIAFEICFAIYFLGYTRTNTFPFRQTKLENYPRCSLFYWFTLRFLNSLLWNITYLLFYFPLFISPYIWFVSDFMWCLLFIIFFLLYFWFGLIQEYIMVTIILIIIKLKHKTIVVPFLGTCDA